MFELNFRYTEEEVRKRQESIEVATILLDAHTEDQSENLRKLLVPAAVEYQAEDTDRASALYNRTYTRLSTTTTVDDVSNFSDEEEAVSESIDRKSVSSDRTFSVDNLLS